MLEIYDDCRGISNGTVLRKFCYGISEVCAFILAYATSQTQACLHLATARGSNTPPLGADLLKRSLVMPRCSAAGYLTDCELYHKCCCPDIVALERLLELYYFVEKSG